MDCNDGSRPALPSTLVHVGYVAVAGRDPPYGFAGGIWRAWFSYVPGRETPMFARLRARHDAVMSNYRRVWVPGGTYFFTVNLLDRRQRLLVEHVDALRVAFRQTHAQRPFEILAIVILPDHLHCL